MIDATSGSAASIQQFSLPKPAEPAPPPVQTPQPAEAAKPAPEAPGQSAYVPPETATQLAIAVVSHAETGLPESSARTSEPTSSSQSQRLADGLIESDVRLELDSLWQRERDMNAAREMMALYPSHIADLQQQLRTAPEYEQKLIMAQLNTTQAALDRITEQYVELSVGWPEFKAQTEARIAALRSQMV